MESNDGTSYFGNDGYQNSAVAIQSQQQPFNNNTAGNSNAKAAALGLFNISKKKLLLTIVYCISFWNFGICVAIFGPTLLDLACQTSSSLSAMTVLYFFQNFTSLLGCLLSGYLVKNKKTGVNDILMISSFFMLICVSLMPLTTHFTFLGIIMVFLGFNMGCIDNIANLAIIKLHSNNVSPFIQAMHFFYGIGAFLTPMVVKMFLDSNFEFSETSSSLNCHNPESSSSPQIFSPFQLQPANNSHPESLQEIILDNPTTKNAFSSQTKYAFWILAAIQTPAPILMFLIRFNRKFNFFQTDDYDDLEEDYQIFNRPSNAPLQDANAPLEQQQSSFQYKNMFSISYLRSFITDMSVFRLTILVALIVFFLEGIQSSHGGFIFSYTVEKYDTVSTVFQKIKSKNGTEKKLLLTKHHRNGDDAYITALFWAFFSIGRLASIYIATKFSIVLMITVDIAGCILSTLLMIFSSMISQVKLLYLATCLLGLFLSNTTPSCYSLAEIHIGVTPTLTTFIIICAATGEMICPLIVANLFELVGANSLVYFEFFISICAAFAFLRFIMYTKADTPYAGLKNSFLWLVSNETTEANPSDGKSFFKAQQSNMYSRMEDEND